jgi:hypothetical protein
VSTVTNVSADTALLVAKIINSGLILTSSKVDGRWLVSIENDGENRTTGVADTPEEALEHAAWPWQLS